MNTNSRDQIWSRDRGLPHVDHVSVTFLPRLGSKTSHVQSLPTRLVYWLSTSLLLCRPQFTSSSLQTPPIMPTRSQLHDSLKSLDRLQRKYLSGPRSKSARRHLTLLSFLRNHLEVSFGSKTMLGKGFNLSQSPLQDRYWSPDRLTPQRVQVPVPHDLDGVCTTSDSIWVRWSLPIDGKASTSSPKVPAGFIHSLISPWVWS